VSISEHKDTTNLCRTENGCAYVRQHDAEVASYGLCSFHFFKLYAFILLTSTLVPGINYFVVTTHALHQLQVRKRSSSSCYMIETYGTLSVQNELSKVPR